jgi:hypothetical protein
MPAVKVPQSGLLACKTGLCSSRLYQVSVARHEASSERILGNSSFMSFSIILREPQASGDKKTPPKLTDKELKFINEFLDDCDEMPLFLWKACRLFSKRGLLLEVNGFFVQAWPNNETALNLFMEQLPGFFRFLNDNSEKRFKLEFYEQGLETDFSFIKNGAADKCEVKIASRIEQPLICKSRTISIAELLGQMRALTETYFAALRECLPSEMDHPWNTRLRAHLDSAWGQGKDAK